jgi:hypothetical protein
MLIYDFKIFWFNFMSHRFVSPSKLNVPPQLISSYLGDSNMNLGSTVLSRYNLNQNNARSLHSTNMIKQSKELDILDKKNMKNQLKESTKSSTIFK